MKHLDLFTGIMGFRLAAEWVWGDEYENVGCCDIDPYCQQLIKLRYPEAKIYGDIRTIKNIGTVDLITGGFPCQPASQAGKRRGTEDDRWLWPEMLRVIRSCKPTWIIAENVGGLITLEEGLVFDNVLADLENEGYEVQPFIIPACAVNAPHRRDRVWIVAYKYSKRLEKEGAEQQTAGIGRENINATNTTKQNDRRSIGKKKGGQIQQSRECDEPKHDTHPECTRRIKGEEERTSERKGGGHKRYFVPDWSRDWKEVAFATCYGRVDDGLPAELDGFKLTKSKHRSERIKALGNAIVPQVAYEIMKGIFNEVPKKHHRLETDD